MSAYIQVVEVSPNQVLGHGNGCIVSEQDIDDCIGPWVVFPHTERASNIYPHATICQHHLDESQRLVLGEALRGGEGEVDDVVQAGDAVEIEDGFDLI